MAKTPKRKISKKTQTKILSSNVTTDTVVGDLTFNNLVVGEWYEVTGRAYFIAANGDGTRDATYVTVTEAEGEQLQNTTDWN